MTAQSEAGGRGFSSSEVGAALRVEADHAVALRRAHPGGEHASALGEGRGVAQVLGEAGAEEQVVAQDQRGGAARPGSARRSGRRRPGRGPSACSA